MNDPAATAPNAETEALLATMALEKVKGEYLSAEQQREEKRRRQSVLERWEAAGYGHLPLPATPQEFERLPLHIRMDLEQRDPELLRMLQPEKPLPAGTELRLAKGVDFLLPEDVPHLLAAGYGDVVQQLRRRYQEDLWQRHEANSQAENEARRLADAAYAREVQEGEQRFNAAMRAQYAARVRQGRG